MKIAVTALKHIKYMVSHILLAVTAFMPLRILSEHCDFLIFALMLYVTFEFCLVLNSLSNNAFVGTSWGSIVGTCQYFKY